MKRKVHYVTLSGEFVRLTIEADEFDALLDSGVDDVVVITPKGRYLASIDDWLDFGYMDLIGDVEVRVLQKAYMGRL